DDVVADDGRVARRERVGDAVLPLDRGEVVHVHGLDAEAVLLEVVDPQRAAPARGRLVDGDERGCLLARHAGAEEECEGEERDETHDGGRLRRAWYAPERGGLRPP